MTRSEIADMFGRRVRPSFACEIRGQLTRDSFPRFVFRIALINNGGGSAESPAIEGAWDIRLIDSMHA